MKPIDCPSMDRLPEDLLVLVSYLKKLPGVGARTAERFAFALLNWPQEDLSSLGGIAQTIKEKLPPCAVCGCLTDRGRCFYCGNEQRNKQQLCIIASAREAFAIEATRSYKGLYHVIEHLISPMDGRHVAMLNMHRIEQRIADNGSNEIILAFDSTLEGEATALYLKKQFSAQAGLSVSRLAFGLPVGSSLEYIDGGTLSRALLGRQTF